MGTYIVVQYASFWSHYLFPWRKNTVQVSNPDEEQMKLDWRARLSLFMLRFVRSHAQPLKAIGRLLEWWLNIIAFNGGLSKTLRKFVFSPQELVFPNEISENYLSAIAHLDPRWDLCVSPDNCFPLACRDSKSTADICAMAAKLAYEGSACVENIVKGVWKMHFIGAYNCWNEYQKKNSTQAFIFSDREYDARAVVVAFRGTEPFNGYDWCTDFDFSWYELPQMGRVHLGFLEALGLGDRSNMHTFQQMKENIYENTRSPAPLTPTSGLPNLVLQDQHKLLGYDHLSEKVRTLLRYNKNAKLYITGHSLGGALAAVFTAMLMYNKEDVITQKLAAVYTFGQPRVGDEKLANFMERKLNQPVNRYFRIVYGNDMVARIPFDNSLFGFKHFGHCFYFNCFYKLQVVQEQPNSNYYSPFYFILARVVSLWELIQSCLLGYIHGEGFRETSLCTITRIAGLFLPGVVGHSLVNYINAIRLGPHHLDPNCPRLKTV